MTDDREHPRGFTADEMNEMRRIVREGGSVEEHLLGKEEPLPPLLKVIMDEMAKRGWEIVTPEAQPGHGRGVFFRKRGRTYPTLDEAVLAQSMQEIADQVIDGS